MFSETEEKNTYQGLVKPPVAVCSFSREVAFVVCQLKAVENIVAAEQAPLTREGAHTGT